MTTQSLRPPSSVVPSHFLAGYTHREVLARAHGLAAGAAVEVLLGPRGPLWVQKIGCLGSQPEGFSFQVVDETGRFFASPLSSLLFAPNTVDNVTLNRKRYERLVLGAVRVQVRNLAGVAQDCDVLLSIAEPDGALVPVGVQGYADALYSAQDLGEGVGVITPAGSSGGNVMAASGRPNLMQSRPIDLSLSNGLALILESQPAAVEVYSLTLFLDGNYPATCSVTVLAETPQGVSRKLCGTFTNVGGGQQISFAYQDEPHFLLQPGERMTMSHSSLVGDLAVFGGQIKFRTL